MKKLSALLVVLFVASLLTVSAQGAEGCCKDKAAGEGCCKAKQECKAEGEKKECKKECPKDAEKKEGCPKADADKAGKTE